MSRITSLPAALQSLLGSTNFGDNPNELLTAVRATIEQLPFLGTYFRRSTFVATTASSSGNFNEIAVPLGEAWMPLFAFAGCINNLAAGQQGKHVIRVSENGAAMPLAIGELQTATDVSETLGVTWQPETPQIWIGGTLVQGHDEVVVDLGSNYTTRMSLTYYKFSL